MSQTAGPSASRADLKQLADLRKRRDRRASGLLLIEGPTLFGEAMDAGLKPQLVAVTSAALEGTPRVREWVRAARAADARVVDLPEHQLSKVSDTQHGTGLVAAIESPSPWDGASLPQTDALVPVLWGLQDPGNVGTLIRSARAFGASACLLAKGSADPTGPKALRASAGAALHLPLGSIENLAELQDLAAASQLEVVLATAPPPGDPSQSLRSPPLPPSCLLVMGHETRGVPELASARKVHVAQTTEVESLNVGVAGSILMAGWFASRPAGWGAGQKSDTHD